MTHKMTVRLSDETWAGLEQVLATNNITASAFFEASAIYLAQTAQQNGLKPYVLWDSDVTATESFAEVFELARAIDVQRRSRRP